MSENSVQKAGITGFVATAGLMEKNPMLGLLRESNRELAKHWFQQMEKVGMRFGLPLKDMKPKSSIYPMLVKKNVHYWLRKKV